MFSLDLRSERIVALALAVLMAATRIHHFGIGSIAPDASTAVFFLAGLLLANPLWFIAYLFEAMVLDAVALGVVGIEAVCMSWGYGLLFLGYYALWFAGSMGRAAERFDLRYAARLLGIAVVAVALFFVASNVGYYYGAGYDESMGAQEYIRRVSRYFSFYLTSTLAYSVAGIALFFMVAHRRIQAVTR